MKDNFWEAILVQGYALLLLLYVINLIIFYILHFIHFIVYSL